jgi:hypothetical protein
MGQSQTALKRLRKIITRATPERPALVAVVDDHRTVDLIRDRLSQDRRLRVMGFTDVRQAISLMNHAPFDVVFCGEKIEGMRAAVVVRIGGSGPLSLPRPVYLKDLLRLIGDLPPC